MGTRLALSFFLVACAFQIGLSQSRVNDMGTGGIHTIQGRIYLPNGKSADSSIQVKLESTNIGSIMVHADINGGFAFRSLAPGNYSVVIDAGPNFEIASEYVTIEVSNTLIAPVPKVVTLPMYLMLKRNSGAYKRAEVINAKIASMPKQAVDLYEAAQKSIADNNPEKAIAELRQSLAIYNAFSLAWNDLGVLLDKVGKTEEALEAFKSAVRFDQDSLAAILNLGCALASAGKADDAEKYLAIALTKDGNSFRGHFYMGVTQMKLGRLDIAEKAFLKAIDVSASGQSGRAHYFLAGVYWAEKRYKQAADHLEKYLDMEPNAKDVVKTRQSIAELRKKQS
jgi:Flp pilus assembly protein TadD